MDGIGELLNGAKGRHNKKISRITICSSLSFAQEIRETARRLEEMGITVEIPDSARRHEKPVGLNEDLEYCLKNDLQMDHFRKIAASDAILVLNLDKGTKRNYIGASVLMEMAVARYLQKRIFLYQGLPDINEDRSAFEVRLAEPILTGGDLSVIADYSFI